MENKKTSAGFLIQSRGLYLIGHSTQDPNYIYSDSDSFWTIPKGIVEENESYLMAAIRETLEETDLNLLMFYDLLGLNAQIEPVNLQSYKFSSEHKNYVIFILDDVDDKLFNFPFECTSLINNERFPKRNGLPELDMFKWATMKEAKNLIFPSFKHIFTEESQVLKTNFH